MLAYFLRVGFVFSTEFPFQEYFYPAVPIGVLWVFVLYYARAYKTEQNIRSFRHFERIGFACLVGMAAYVITFFFLRKFLFSRAIILMVFVLSTLFIYVSHYIYSLIARSYYKKGIGVYRTLIVGANREAEKLVKKLKQQGSVYMPVAMLDAYGSKLKEVSGVPMKGKLNKFEEVIKEDSIDYIIQTDNLEQTINIMNYALQNNIKYALLPSLLGAYHKKQFVEEIEGVPVLRVE